MVQMLNISNPSPEKPLSSQDGLITEISSRQSKTVPDSSISPRKASALELQKAC
jgi:hypothetical protein